MIRLDRDPDGPNHVGKGIHWNAKYKTDSSRKLAAKISGTTGNTEAMKKRMDGYVAKLQGKTAQQIWEAWSKGNAPGP